LCQLLKINSVDFTYHFHITEIDHTVVKDWFFKIYNCSKSSFAKSVTFASSRERLHISNRIVSRYKNFIYNYKFI